MAKNGGMMDEVNKSLTGKKANAAGERWTKRIKEYLEDYGWDVIQAKKVYSRFPKKVGRNTIWLFRSKREDFLGFGDLLAFHPLKSYTVWIQTHLGTHVNERKAKAEVLNLNPFGNRCFILRRGKARSSVEVHRFTPALKKPFCWAVQEYSLGGAPEWLL